MAQGARELQQVRPNRIPPHNLDAEQSVLGAMLESQDAIANVVEILSPDDFYKPAHTEIYEAILALFNRHQAIDAITIVEELSRRGTIEGVGGRPYILGLLEAYPTASATSSGIENPISCTSLPALIRRRSNASSSTMRA